EPAADRCSTEAGAPKRLDRCGGVVRVRRTAGRPAPPARASLRPHEVPDRPRQGPLPGLPQGEDAPRRRVHVLAGPPARPLFRAPGIRASTPPGPLPRALRPTAPTSASGPSAGSPSCARGYERVVEPTPLPVAPTPRTARAVSSGLAEPPASANPPPAVS